MRTRKDCLDRTTGNSKGRTWSSLAINAHIYCPTFLWRISKIGDEKKHDIHSYIFGKLHVALSKLRPTCADAMEICLPISI